MLRYLTIATQNYLMNLFWSCFNNATPVVDQSSFEQDRSTNSYQFYSSFLFISTLAMGCRFADPNRPDIRELFTNSRISVLHQALKHMAENELEGPGGLPSVQGMLILADLEYGIGNDASSWTYAGMNRSSIFFAFKRKPKRH